uniref:TATA box-binding protein-like 1 n=1 Tax=Anopheles dirus TaxID=7168 RepID=A0A182NHS7_9DIPT
AVVRAEHEHIGASLILPSSSRNAACALTVNGAEWTVWNATRMVGNSSFISNAITTSSSALNASGNNGSSSPIARNGTNFGGISVLDVNTVPANGVVNVAKGFLLRQQNYHHNQLIQQQQQQRHTSSNTSGVIAPSHLQSSANGMINHSSLMFATATTTTTTTKAVTNHPQQLSVGITNEKKTLAGNLVKGGGGESPTGGVVTNNTTSIPLSTATNTPTDTDSRTTELEPLETKEPSADGEPQQDDQPEIDIVINNVVCSFSVRCHLNLQEIARCANNVEFRRENGMVTMKLRRPYTTASIWSSGKITCTGATSEHQAKIAARRYSRCLQKLGFNVRFRNFRIVNVLGTCSMPWGIMIVNFSERYKKDASYEPELHPGVTYKLQSPKATLKIFSTGSITVTAASVAFVQAAIEQIFPLVYEFRKKRTPLEKQALVKQPPPTDFDPHDVDHLIEEDREGALAEAEQQGLTYWNETDVQPDGQQPAADYEMEEFGDADDDDDDNEHGGGARGRNTKAIHKINSIRQNGRKRRVRQLRPAGRVTNDGDSASDDDLCVSDFE